MEIEMPLNLLIIDDNAALNQLIVDVRRFAGKRAECADGAQALSGDKV